MADEAVKKVPVTVLTGFLGSGKTTFVQYILTQQHGRKIAVIQNEFGQPIGVEEAMVMGSDGSSASEWLDLPNGCVCCSVRDDLVLTIENLLSRRKDLDHVIIETTGLADPGPVASVFWMDDELESALYLDAIVTIVDAKNILHHLDKPVQPDSVNEAERQVACADRIILNKTDLVTQEHLAKLMDRLRGLNLDAPVLRSTFSKVPLAEVLDTGAFTAANMSQLPHFQLPEKGVVYAHTREVKNTAITTNSYLDENALTRWLGSWMWQLDDEDDLAKKHGMHIYRVKGVVALEDSDKQHWLQGVHNMFDFTETALNWPDPKRPETKIVLIGRNLDAQVLQKSFDDVFGSGK